MKKLNLYKVSYKNGLKNDMVVEAENELEAGKMALAEYRKNFGADGILSESKIKDVVKSVELI